jgi:hypothetical protein
MAWALLSQAQRTPLAPRCCCCCQGVLDMGSATVSSSSPGITWKERALYCQVRHLSLPACLPACRLRDLTPLALLLCPWKNLTWLRLPRQPPGKPVRPGAGASLPALLAGVASSRRLAHALAYFLSSHAMLGSNMRAQCVRHRCRSLRFGAIRQSIPCGDRHHAACPAWRGHTCQAAWAVACPCLARMSWPFF